MFSEQKKRPFLNENGDRPVICTCCDHHCSIIRFLYVKSALGPVDQKANKPLIFIFQMGHPSVELRAF